MTNKKSHKNLSFILEYSESNVACTGKSIEQYQPPVNPRHTERTRPLYLCLCMFVYLQFVTIYSGTVS